MQLERLGNYIKILSGFPFKSEHFNKEGIGLPLIRVRDVNSGFSGMYYSGNYSNEYVIHNGDILIGMDGDFNAIAWKNGKALLNQRVCKLVVDEGKLNKNYMLQYLPLELKSIHGKTTYTTVKHLSAKSIEVIKIPLPSLNDQIRIANVLTRAETLIAKRKESIKGLDEFLNSTFVEMFGEVISHHGKSYIFDDLKTDGKGTFSNGPFGSDLLTSELNSEGGIPVIYIRDIKNGYLEWKSNVFVTPQKASLLPNCNVIPGDLLLAKVGDPPGIAAVCEESMKTAIITQDVIRLRLNSRIVNPVYLCNFINSDLGKRLIKKITVKGTRSRFSLGDLKKLQLKLPDITLQNRFVAIVKKVENLKARYTQSLNDLENLYGSLNQRVFKGELDLSKIPVMFEAESEEYKMTGVNEVELRTKLKFTDKDLFELLNSYSGKIFSFDEIWKQIEALTGKEIPLKYEIQNQIVELLESDKANLQQVFNVLSSEAEKHDSKKQIAFRGNYEN